MRRSIASRGISVPFQDLSLRRVFFMQIYDANDTTLLATTHYFNMTGDTSSLSSSAAASSASSNMSLATTALKTTSTAASTSAAATSTAAPRSNSNYTLAIGVGVGVGIGVFLAAAGSAIGVVFCLRNRRLQKRQSAALSTMNPSPYKYTHDHELPREDNNNLAAELAEFLTSRTAVKSHGDCYRGRSTILVILLMPSLAHDRYKVTSPVIIMDHPRP
jgi:hypothetical protein